MPEGRTLRIAGGMLAAHPVRSALVIGLSLLSGLAEGVSVVSLLPMLGIAAGLDVEGMPAVAAFVERALSVVNLSPTIPVLLAFIAIGIIGKAILKVLALWQAGAAAAQVAADLRLALIQRLMGAEWGYFVRLPSGRMTNAISTEAQRSSDVFLGATNMISGAVQLAVYVGVAVAVSWEVALVALASGAFMVWGLSGLVRSSKRAGAHQTRLLSSLMARLTDTLYAIKPLKAMAREASITRVLEEETRDINQAQRREVVNKAAVGSFHEPIITVFVCLLIYVLLVVQNVPFSEILFMAFVLYRTVQNIGVVQNHYQRIGVAESALVSLSRSIHEAEKSAEVLSSGTEPPRLRRGITFDNVSFSYGDKSILDSFDAVIPAGQITAIVGPSGIGKTTLADLLAGLYQPSSGEILLDDTPLAEIDLHGWRRSIGYVPQDGVLFHDTVARNVWMSKGEPNEEDVEWALRSAEAWEFVSDLPMGVRTVVGERGLRLSGGQRQRLAIARAMIHRPQLLLLDEATTALDPATEQEILQTIAALRGEVTVLAISHQQGVMSIADHVIELENSSQLSA